jgi:Flp pilus assembly protein TadB
MRERMQAYRPCFAFRSESDFNEGKEERVRSGFATLQLCANLVLLLLAVLLGPRSRNKKKKRNEERRTKKKTSKKATVVWLRVIYPQRNADCKLSRQNQGSPQSRGDWRLWVPIFFSFSFLICLACAPFLYRGFLVYQALERLLYCTST